MDSAKTILHLIELAAQQVRNATARYSTTKGVRKVRQHSLIRLESEFQTIANASRAIIKVLNDPLLSRDYLLDDRLVEWLSGTEPETCLDALSEMGKLLSIEREVQAFSGITPTRSACEEDDIHAAIVLFHSHNAHFHFLLATDIWNHRNEVHRQMTPSRTEDARVQGHGQPQSTQARDIARVSQRKEIVSQKLKRLLKILDALDCSEKHRETSSMRQSDTCMWLPATEAYRSWREGKGSFLWLQGKAGAGKSVLFFRYQRPQ
ncbi:hypothetical protein OG21DRAFT_151486 [Imleria badia]|nr:hypothetical protein OG21DRAFT_151486 [Imleria badia]